MEIIKYDFTALDTLISTIQKEITDIDASYKQRVEMMTDSLRRAEEENQLRQKKERELEEQQRRELEKQKLQERIKQEAILRQKQEEEEENLRKSQLEKKRLLEEQNQIEQNRKKQIQSEATKRQQLLDADLNLKRENYIKKLKELQTLEKPDNIKEIDKLIKELNSLSTYSIYNDNLENVTSKITVIDKIILFIRSQSSNTVSDVKKSEAYNIILRDIIFLMSSFNNKSTEIKKKIKDSFDTNNSVKFSKIQELYKNAIIDKNMNLFIDKNKQDYFKLNNYSEIMNYITNTINKNENTELLKNKVSDLYEIIAGTARVIVRFKPKDGDNTAPSIRKVDKGGYNSTKYLEIENGKTNKQVILHGGSLQYGGYNYNDIIKVIPTNNLQIGKICEDSEIPTNTTYGPYYSIYPYNYNNFHIYYNMFGNTSLASTDINTPEVANYDTLLQSQNVNNQAHNLMKKLKKGDSVVIFGYGFSGSGKTYALIEGSESADGIIQGNIKYDPSILEQFIKTNIDSIESVEFLELYPLGVSHNPHKALYTEYQITDTDTGLINVINNKKITYSNQEENIDINKLREYANQSGINLTNDNVTNLYSTITKKDSISFDIISERIKLLERHRIEKLRILATPNNDKSSRSFLQITLNLTKVGEKTPKLVFFDMPGTENTVRIKTQFLGEEFFDRLKNNPIKYTIRDGTKIINQTNAMFTQNKYYDNFVSVDDKISDIYFKRIHKFIVKSDIINVETIFKYFIFEKIIFNNLSIRFLKDETIAHDSLELAAFVNGIDIQRGETFNDTYKNITNNGIKELLFITDDLFILIVKNFITFLLQKDEKSEKILKTDENNYKNNKYFFIGTESNKFCKIESKLDENDKINIKNIFNIIFNNADANTNIIHIDLKVPNFYDLGKIIINKENANGIIDIKIKAINADKTPQNAIYFANPLIKYIYYILNYIYSKYIRLNDSTIKGTLIEGRLNQVFYRAATFFIYKYINFIVNQGRSIVTNLEHLKFFFLSRTGSINEYNNKHNKINGDSSFYCKDIECNDIIGKIKEYTKPTKVGKSMTIYERINLGNMKVYGLIDILQELAESPLLENCECEENTINRGQYNLDLLKIKAQAQTNNLLGAIFIMFSNYKIYLDDDTISNLPIDTAKKENKIKTLCIAAHDTSEFTDSISSTSINKEIAPTEKISTKENTFAIDYKDSIFKDLQPAIAVGGKRKFNLNQLLNNNNNYNNNNYNYNYNNNHNNKRPRTHRNLSVKNKKNRVFHNRTKKNI